MVRDGVLLLVLERSSDKALEQGMCAVGAALELGVELCAEVEDRPRKTSRRTGKETS